MKALVQAACVLLLLSALGCDDKTASFFLPGATSPKTGNLTGLVLGGAAPIPGAFVTLLGTNRSTRSESSGSYTITDLNLGSYTVTASVSGHSCSALAVNIQLDITTTANIVCAPRPGGVGGNVSVNGVFLGSQGIVVTVRDATTNAAVGTATSGFTGFYSVFPVLPGNYTVSVASGAGQSFELDCPNNPRAIAVFADASTTANFDCASRPRSTAGAP